MPVSTIANSKKNHGRNDKTTWKALHVKEGIFHLSRAGRMVPSSLCKNLSSVLFVVQKKTP